MSDELRELLVELAIGGLGVVVTVIGGYLGRKGWKGYIARRILNAVIEEVVDRLNNTTVPRMKADTMTTHPEKGYDLTPLQVRAVMNEAKDRVITQVTEVAEQKRVPVIIPPVVKLQEKIEEVVQRKKLDRQTASPNQRLGKGF